MTPANAARSRTSRCRASLRDELIAAGRARPHSAMPDSGWLTVPVRTAADLAGAVEVFRIAYERARRKRAPARSAV